MQYVQLFSIVLLAGMANAGTYSGGSGTEAQPYRIGTVADWLELIDRPAEWGKCFVLTADIDFDDAEIMPVGTWSDRFTGVLDGNGYVLRNFVINQPDSDYIGLFGYIDGSGEVFGIGLVNVVITGKQFVGGLCGKNRGTISTSYVVGAVVGCDGHIGGLCGWNYEGTISDSYAMGSVEGLERIGGFCGHNSGTISDSYATGIVEGLEWVGGLCGENSGAISDSYATGAVDGRGIVGGLCGENSGAISYSYSTGAVDGKGSVGGLCGQNFGAISDSYAMGMVTGTEGSLGGLCGWNYAGTIMSSYAMGAVTAGDGSFGVFIGGLCGWNMDGTISDSYAAGAVTVSDGSIGVLVGGLCGINQGTISSSFWDMDTSGQGESDGGEGKTVIEMKTLSTFTDAGWDFVHTWKMYSNSYPRLVRETVVLVTMPDLIGLTPIQAQATLQAAGLALANIIYEYSTVVAAGSIMGQLPAAGLSLPEGEGISVFVSMGSVYSGGEGTEGNPYRISTVADWLRLIDKPEHWDKHFVLTGDIDFDGVEITPLGTSATPFIGVVDGNDHSLSNFVIELPGSDHVGLFGYIDSGGEVFGLGLVDFEVTGKNSVGGLCGWNNGTISNSCTLGVVQGGDNVGGLCGQNNGIIIAGYASGAVTGDESVGGLCGNNYHGAISDSYAAGDVSGNGNSVGGLCGWNFKGTISESYALGAVEGEIIIGGLCGWNFEGIIRNSHASGPVLGMGITGGFCGYNSGTIINSYATGQVDGNYLNGGFCGYNEDAISGSFWNTETSGWTTSAGGEGKTTAEMQMLSTFTDAGWDFETVWVKPADSYPQLQWTAWVSSTPDLDGDGVVDIADFTIWVEYALDSECHFPDWCGGADLNRDGIVNLKDFAILATHWLTGL